MKELQYKFFDQKMTVQAAKDRVLLEKKKLKSLEQKALRGIHLGHQQIVLLKQSCEKLASEIIKAERKIKDRSE